ncbi:MAG: hypothetical protein R3B84_18290 [Zavarzinella sp.]
MRVFSQIVLLFLVGQISAAPVKPPAAPKVDLDPEAVQVWGNADVVLVATITEALAGPVGLSDPPLYSFQLRLQIEESLRGGYPKGNEVRGYYSIRTRNKPEFVKGTKVVVAGNNARQLVLTKIETADDKLLAQARNGTALPVGWKLDGDKLISPWAGIANFWNLPKDPNQQLACSVSGRPIAYLGKSFQFTCEPVPPPREVKFANPDGDGIYKVSLKNTTADELYVPCLLARDGKPLWKESLLIICQDKVYTIPGCGKVAATDTLFTLKAGEEVSTTVNALELDGPQWPRGGYRIGFTFVLGEKAITKSFYYLSRHHDPIRDALKKK